MSQKMFDLGGRTALVTGSSRGLGKAYAEGLADAGAAIVLNGHDAARLAATAAELRAKGYTVHEALFDVTDEAAVTEAFAKLDAQGVAVDILVNNAGIQLRKPLVDLSMEEWRKVIDTNLNSAFLVGREAARRMIARGRGGKVINIGSLTSEVARATVAPYTAAKGGIKLLTKAMAAEWAEHGISVNAVGPGYIVTEMTQPLVDTPSFDNWVKQRTPARRWGTPADVAGTVIFLASAAADFVNGQIIYVDGGMLSVL
ncbi:SDR family oxidoreductase [Telmatospirillum sp.]|uniref:SDR family oxidoreductase n=1 Tax=Telmatospirillum sp. TaxID=2079197 RepID=UPI00284BB29F|nr:SDR family oxidoreductase [Telmatospirillum sp.]MDR3437386.1 SDR family oxidoreductase [Telmatospirillum sp.]